MDWTNKVVLITGGTGTIGHALVERLLKEPVQSIRIYSRDERKQEDMTRKWEHESRIHGGRLRFLIGDVRDRERLRLALKGVHYVVHAAALKIVPSCFYNPTEALSTNVYGTLNLMFAALHEYVERVVTLSTDKACEAVTLYGASKAMAEHLMIAGNNYGGDYFQTRFCVVRYGNVVNSRGSVLPLFIEQAKKGEFTVTDRDATRFWIRQDQAVNLILKALEETRGGEVYVPKAQSMRVMDLVSAIDNAVPVRTVGLRVGEKVHEVLVTHEEARRTKDAGDCYVIEPEGACWAREPLPYPRVKAHFRYVSNGGTSWVTAEEFKAQARELETGVN